jgi:hypothetical protein
MALNLDSIVAVSRDQVHTAVDDEVVILHLESSIYYGLDPVGRRVWELIQAPLPVREVVARLIEEFAVGREECEQDVLRLLAELAAEKLVTVQG